jgi:hypothetical protein
VDLETRAGDDEGIGRVVEKEVRSRNLPMRRA